MQAVILTAGRGTRLKPLTDFVPKPLLPIDGKPVLQCVIESMKDAGIDDLLIGTGHGSEMLKRFVDTLHLDRVRYFSCDDETGGMLSGLGAASSLLNQDFLLTASDTIFPAKYVRQMLNAHERRRPAASLSISDLGCARRLVGRSVVGMSADGRVNRIVEKPTFAEIFSTLVSTPLYTLSPIIFEYIPRVQLSSRGEYELQSALQLMIDDGLFVQGVMHVAWNDLSQWQMLNDCYDFLRLNFSYLQKELPPR